MADIQIVMQVVGEKSIVNATKSTINLENKVKSLSKSLEAGRISEGQFSTGLKELRRTLDGNGKAWQSNKAQIDNYVKSLKSAEAAQKANAAAQEAAKKQAQAVREMNAALAAQKRAQDENTASLSRLRAGYDATYAAEQRRLELKRRLRQEILNGNMTLREAGAELLKYRQHVQQFNTAQMAATKGSNRFGVVTQQAGYQVGDFLVQIQSGTNPMVAFGQQATQLVGILPLLGAGFMGLSAGALVGLSAGLGVAIPLVTALGAAFMRTSGSSDSAAGGFSTMEAAMKSAREESTRMADEIERLNRGIEDNTQFIVVRAIEQQKLRVAEAQALADQVAGTDGGFVAEERLRREQETLREYEAQLQTLIDQSAELDNINDKREKEARIASTLRPLMGQIRAETTFVTEETIELTKRMGGSVEEAIKLQKALDEGKISASQLRGIDLEKGITPAVKAAKELAEQLGISFRIAAALSGAIVRGDDAEALDPRSQRYDAGAAYLARMRELVESGDLYTKPKTPRGGKTEAEQLAERIAKFEEQLRLEQELIGKSEARRRVIQALGVEFTQQNAAAVATYEAQIEAIIEATRLEQERKALMDSIESSIEDGFMAMVDGTKSVKDAFKDMARQIIAELYRVLVVQRLVRGISGALGFADGGVFSGGSQIKAFANGGVVGSPTYFPMAGGKTGLMGEAGPEAIMPLKRDKNGRLGVSVEGGSGSVVVNNNINVTGGSDPAAIRMEVAKLMPQITNATKTAVIDARRRGGQMKAAFG